MSGKLKKKILKERKARKAAREDARGKLEASLEVLSLSGSGSADASEGSEPPPSLLGPQQRPPPRARPTPLESISTQYPLLLPLHPRVGQRTSAKKPIPPAHYKCVTSWVLLTRRAVSLAGPSGVPYGLCQLSFSAGPFSGGHGWNVNRYPNRHPGHPLMLELRRASEAMLASCLVWCEREGSEGQRERVGGVLVKVRRGLGGGRVDEEGEAEEGEAHGGGGPRRDGFRAGASGRWYLAVPAAGELEPRAL